MSVSDMYICQGINLWWLAATVVLIGVFGWAWGYASGRGSR